MPRSDDLTFKLLTRWLGNKTELAEGESRDDKTNIMTCDSDINPMIMNLGWCIDFMNAYRANIKPKVRNEKPK